MPVGQQIYVTVSGDLEGKIAIIDFMPLAAQVDPNNRQNANRSPTKSMRSQELSQFCRNRFVATPQN